MNEERPAGIVCLCWAGHTNQSSWNCSSYHKTLVNRLYVHTTATGRSRKLSFEVIGCIAAITITIIVIVMIRRCGIMRSMKQIETAFPSSKDFPPLAFSLLGMASSSQCISSAGHPSVSTTMKTTSAQTEPHWNREPLREISKGKNDNTPE